MAELLWGQVYLGDRYAGVLRQEPGDRCSFTYDTSYLSTARTAIAWTLPLQEQSHVSPLGLHPFFDNLVAEGWLEDAQRRLLGRRQASRFELLLAFGQDCAGAVSVVDPKPIPLTQDRVDPGDPRQVAIFKSRASLSGIQPKLALVREQGKYRPAAAGETSTHFAKFSSAKHADLVTNEYLVMQALRVLLPSEPVAEIKIGNVVGFPDSALIITRFDRGPRGKRIHFEEFNQLLGRSIDAKYDGSHREMADFLRKTPGCLPTEIYRLFLRIAAGLLLGNTDMHFKNFAMFHTADGLRLTPSYDQVAAVLYGYDRLALLIGGAELSWNDLKPKSVIKLGEDFGLSRPAIAMAYEMLVKRREAMLDAVNEDSQAHAVLKSDLIKMVNRRWNGTFSLIGQALSKKR